MATRLFSTSVSTSDGTGSSSCSSAGEISGRTAPMRTSSMRVESSVESATPTSWSIRGLSMRLKVVLPGLQWANDDYRIRSGTAGILRGAFRQSSAVLQAGVVSTIEPVAAALTIASVMRRFCNPSRALTIGSASPRTTRPKCSI